MLAAALTACAHRAEPWQTAPTPYFRGGAWREQFPAAPPEAGCVAVPEVVGPNGETYRCGAPGWAGGQCAPALNCASPRTPGVPYEHLGMPGEPSFHRYRTPAGFDVECALGPEAYAGPLDDEFSADYDSCRRIDRAAGPR